MGRGKLTPRLAPWGAVAKPRGGHHALTGHARESPMKLYLDTAVIAEIEEAAVPVGARP